MADTRNDGDHPQTVKLEPDARGGPAAAAEETRRQADASTDEGDERDEASPRRDLDAVLGADAEAIRAHAAGARSMGDAIGSSAGRGVGSGTPGDKGDLGGGE